MIHIYTQIVKYLMMFFMILYVLESFRVFRLRNNERALKHLYIRQRVLLYFNHFMAFSVLYFNSMDFQLIGLYLLQVILLTAIILIYSLFYRNSSKLVLNNMCMLLSVGFIILTRLSYTKSLRQYLFALAGAVIATLIPVILQHVSMFRNLTWFYAVVGILSLLVVTVAGSVSFGAKLSISIGGISIQPSEFVKIIFVFFIASMLRVKTDLKQLAITSAISAVFVLCLVASKDLGGALLYFVTYLVMVYVATGKFYYFLGGSAVMCAAAFLGYKIFSHVQTRVIAWQDPLASYDGAGYQVSQSLFGIGTGGWFGLGLCQGLPNKIPVVENDFVFAAISEELGGIFGLCIIMVCLSCFLMFMNIAMKMKDPFYKLVALGLGTIYAMQVVLTIGGQIKFIPSTGVTLPLISYGGSSLLSTMIIFGVIQGLYLRNKDDINKEAANTIQPVAPAYPGYPGYGNEEA